MSSESPPVASTSTAPPPAPSTSGIGTKRKKLPACDSCRLRRLKCEPQPPPSSCPRCKQTGVVCTTTPTVRKKAAPRTGKRIEEAKATFGTADALTPELMGASNTPWLGRTVDGDTTLATGVKAPDLGEGGLEGRLMAREMDGAIVAHLLELYQAVPQSWLPISVRGKLLLQFEAAGRRLEALDPQTEVLARVTIAITSRLSSHPALFGSSSTSSPIPAFESLTPEYLEQRRDLREYGRRREEICESLRKVAVEMAWERGTLVKTTEESMASCYLLEMLEGRNDPNAGKPYGSAFVSHLQTILNGQDQPGATMKIQTMSLGWSALIMRETLYAANAGRTSHFTATDDLLLCGAVPVSIEEALFDTVEDVDVRDSVTLFFSPMRPYTYHCARLARECSEQLTGTYARRQPFNERFLTTYLTSLDHLLHLFAILEARIAFVLSPAATSAHSLPAPFETERQFIMRACLYTLSLAWSSLSLPVYTELTRRLTDLRQPPPAALPPHALAERHRTTERLTLLLRQVHTSVLKGGRMVAQCVHEAPSLAFCVYLQSENLERWTRVLVEAKTVEEGGETGYTIEEKERDLRWIRDGLLTMGWSYTDSGPLISALDAELGELSLENQDDGQQEQPQYEQPSLNLPHPTPFFVDNLDSPFGVQASMPGASPFADFASLDSSSLPNPSSTTAAFDPSTFLASPPPAANLAATPLPPPAAPPSSSAASLLASLFPPSTPSGPPAVPDIGTLISLYSSGALQPIIEAHGLNVPQLAGQFLSGRLDLGAMLARMTEREGAGGGPGGGVAAAGEGGGGAVDGEGEQRREESGFDLEAMLAEPLFGPAGSEGQGTSQGAVEL